MFTIAAILIGLAGCLWGIKKGFIPSWILLFNVVFSAYLSVMLVALTGKYLPDSLPNQWAKAGDLLFTAVFLFVMLQALSIHIFDEMPSPDLPKYFESVGAGICGFAAGYLIFWIVVYSVAITPIGKLGFMKLNAENKPTAVEAGRGKIDMLCGVIECLSLQEYDKESEKLYMWLESPKAKFIRKPKAQTQTAKAAEPAAKTNCSAAPAAKKINAADPNSEPNQPAAK